MKNTTDQTSEPKKTEEQAASPRHWVELKELSPGYWRDTKAQEIRGQEFFEKPLEQLEKIDQSGKGGIARRDFLTIMGASMAMTTFACVRRPVHKIIPHVVRPEEIVPGVSYYYASTCQECEAGCGILTKNREGRPIKIEGNPDHPVNKGALCARGQASLLSLYDPDRIAGPFQLAKAMGTHQAITWEKADAQLLSELAQAAQSQGKIRFLSRPFTSPSTRKLVNEFLAKFRNAEHVEFEPLSLEEIADAQAESYGSAFFPNYDFSKADVVLSLGADFLGTWLSPVEYSSQWVKKRKLESKDASRAKMSKLIVAESMMSVTGASSDERLPIRPGDELKIALAVAHEIIITKGSSRFAGQSTVKNLLEGYSPKAVAAELGGAVKAETIVSIANDLLHAKGSSLVIGGSAVSKSGEGMALQVAINLLNSALENEGKTVWGGSDTRAKLASFKEMLKLIDEMKKGEVKALFIHKSNPVYALASELGFEEALKKVPLVISFADRIDETAKFANYILPDHHTLENWGDANPRGAVYSLQQPAIAPMNQTRAMQDTVLTLMGRKDSWHEYLRANWKEKFYPQAYVAFDFDTFWDKTLEKGVFLPKGAVSSGSSSREFKMASLQKLPSYKADSREGLKLGLYEKISMGDGSSANNAWLQEMPDPISTATWDNYLNVSVAAAAQYQLKNDDVVEVSDGSKMKFELPVYIQPGLHPMTVTAALGYGRESAGIVGTGVGKNLFKFTGSSKDYAVFSGQNVRLRKTAKRYELAVTQGHHKTEGRPIVNDITFAEFKKNPGAAAHTDPHLRLKEIPSTWNAHEYKEPYRWGMSIDMNACTGCGACVIACQAENNIPVVGRDQVRRGREMHWIRIDRYYSGSESAPGVVFQPMMCQHCENAPCETVCPVLATVHDKEGLNDMVYNRCVGTRYCQNNCPYKVRRFNFFDHYKDYKEPMNKVYNPDVTVRMRGVMEKCTFCVQRIQGAKGKAKDEKRLVLDGEMVTACQQTCPTEAITFGNIHDQKSKVVEQKADARAYRVLEILNVKPSVSYLTKVRNVEAEEGAHHGHS